MPLQSRKLPNEISTEDLISVVENNPNESEVKSPPDDSILGFLSFYNIKDGPNPIHSEILYKLYSLWSSQKLSQKGFGKYISKYLIQATQKNSRRRYYINLDALNLTQKALELLKSKTIQKTKSPFYKKHYESFLSSHNITKGDYWIEIFILYYLYDLWIYKIKSKSPMNKANFTKFSKLYFEHKISKRVTWFAVDKSITDLLSEEHLKQLREGNEKKYIKEIAKKRKRKKEAKS